MYSFTKLLYCYLKPYIVKKQVGLILCHLKLSPILQKLHLVFLVVKLTTISNNLISKRYSSPLSNLVIINGEEE